MSTVTQAEMLKAIDRLVREGRAEHTIIDGKPAIRLIKENVSPKSDVAKDGGAGRL